MQFEVHIVLRKSSEKFDKKVYIISNMISNPGGILRSLLLLIAIGELEQTITWLISNWKLATLKLDNRIGQIEF